MDILPNIYVFNIHLTCHLSIVYIFILSELNAFSIIFLYLSINVVTGILKLISVMLIPLNY